MAIKVKQIAYHRNGVMGLGFHAVLFTDPSQPKAAEFLATVFDQPNAVAIVRLDIIGEVGVTFGENSWRCESYEDDLRSAIEIWKIEQ